MWAILIQSRKQLARTLPPKCSRVLALLPAQATSQFCHCECALHKHLNDFAAFCISACSVCRINMCPILMC